MDERGWSRILAVTAGFGAGVLLVTAAAEHQTGTLRGGPDSQQPLDAVAAFAPERPVFSSGIRPGDLPEHATPGPAASEPWWRYELVHRSVPPDPASIRLLDSGRGQAAWQQSRAFPEPARDPAIESWTAVATQIAGRWNRQGSGQDLPNMAPAGPVATVRFEVVDAETGRPISSLLTDSLGAPLGPIDDVHVRLALPFQGYVTAPGYAPAAVTIHRPEQPCTIRLHRAGYARGRICGAFAVGDELSMAGTLPDGANLRIELDACGVFRLGPAPLGRMQLRLTSRVGELQAAQAGFDLTVQEQDLGDLVAQPLGRLALQLVGPAAGATAHGVVWWADGNGAAALASDAALRHLGILDQQKEVVFQRLRRGLLAGLVWTSDGWTGRLPALNWELLRDGSPTRIHCEQPGTLELRCEATGDLDGATILAIEDSHGLDPRAWRTGAGRGNGWRVREQAWRPGPSQTLRALWAGSYSVHLLDRRGWLLGKTDVRILPGQTTSIWLPRLPADATLTLRNGRDEQPIRVFVTSLTSGALHRGALTVEKSLCLPGLVAGTYEVVVVGGSAAAAGESMRHRVELEPGGAATVTLGRTR